MAKNLLDVLVAQGTLSVEEVPAIRTEAKKEGVPPEEILYRKGVDENVILEIKSQILGVPIYRLEGARVDYSVLRLIPEESAMLYKFAPLRVADGMLEIGMLQPDDVTAQQALKFLSSRIKKPFKTFVISPSDFKAIMEEYKSLAGEVTRALTEFEESAVKPVKEKSEKIELTRDAPITKIVDLVVRYAVQEHASDIHIEPLKDQVRVRFRIDGILHTNLTLPLTSHQSIINRVKIMTKMKIDETRVPQDGRFNTLINGKSVDFRVASLPTPYGEKVAIRILDPDAGVKTLEDLGFSGRNLNVMKEVIEKPYGMILITGPTGSGKSTTLYALLQLLNKEGVNIISLEDPVEYYIDGMNQSQIRPEIGYDFATGLRNILRQDPDIIMVGEIRDKETAKLATQAALTGHLVLSTLHTNNAIGVIPRLIDMGVDPFLLPSTLLLMVGQRLSRRLCADSKDLLPPDSPYYQMLAQEVAKMPKLYRDELEKKKPWQIFTGRISPACPKGMSGRIGIYETLAMTPGLQQIIAEGATEAKLAEEASRQNMLTMRQDGIIKALAGMISLEELFDVS